MKIPGMFMNMARVMDAEGLLQNWRVKKNLNTRDLSMISKHAEIVYLNKSLDPGSS